MKATSTTTTKVRIGDVVMVRARSQHAAGKAMPAMITDIAARAPLIEDAVAIAIVSLSAFPIAAAPVFLQVPLYEAEPAGTHAAAWVRR